MREYGGVLYEETILGDSFLNFILHEWMILIIYWYGAHVTCSPNVSVHLHLLSLTQRECAPPFAFVSVWRVLEIRSCLDIC